MSADWYCVICSLAVRGRLNVLINVLRKPAGVVFSEMEGHQSAFHVGDVKYHLGKSGRLHTWTTMVCRDAKVGAKVGVPTRVHQGGVRRHVDVGLLPNPSHLEAVTSVLLGSVRGHQDRSDGPPGALLGVALHGDAAFAGLGGVVECLQLSRLPGMTSG